MPIVEMKKAQIKRKFSLKMTKAQNLLATNNIYPIADMTKTQILIRISK
jgi:hypothetical protein